MNFEKGGWGARRLSKTWGGLNTIQQFQTINHRGERSEFFFRWPNQCNSEIETPNEGHHSRDQRTSRSTAAFDVLRLKKPQAGCAVKPGPGLRSPPTSWSDLNTHTSKLPSRIIEVIAVALAVGTTLVCALSSVLPTAVVGPLEVWSLKAKMNGPHGTALAPAVTPWSAGAAFLVGPRAAPGQCARG